MFLNNEVESSLHRSNTMKFMNFLHASWSVRVTAVPLCGTEESEENASSEETGCHGGCLEKDEI